MNRAIIIIIGRIQNPHDQLQIRGGKDEGPTMVGLDPMSTPVKGLSRGEMRKALEGHVRMEAADMTHVGSKRVSRPHGWLWRPFRPCHMERTHPRSH